MNSKRILTCIWNCSSTDPTKLASNVNIWFHSVSLIYWQIDWKKVLRFKHLVYILETNLNFSTNCSHHMKQAPCLLKLGNPSSLTFVYFQGCNCNLNCSPLLLSLHAPLLKKTTQSQALCDFSRLQTVVNILSSSQLCKLCKMTWSNCRLLYCCFDNVLVSHLYWIVINCKIWIGQPWI